ncbi:unnamed protein product [Pleuronectes platessa]|uniref:Uncharacterized protein n=1 Tax=Pleuronectes platessa TaxID=8262 RepID=A0A9N7TLX5_PLEPL|nr:unnamed protein product [Pleuronectes platessa]
MADFLMYPSSTYVTAVWRMQEEIFRVTHARDNRKMPRTFRRWVVSGQSMEASAPGGVGCRRVLSLFKDSTPQSQNNKSLGFRKSNGGMPGTKGDEDFNVHDPKHLVRLPQSLRANVSVSLEALTEVSTVQSPRSQVDKKRGRKRQHILPSPAHCQMDQRKGLCLLPWLISSLICGECERNSGGGSLLRRGREMEVWLGRERGCGGKRAEENAERPSTGPVRALGIFPDGL